MANRVTTTMMYSTLMGSLQNNLQSLLDLERQASTQEKYAKLSDNPSAIARALAIESSLTFNSQYITNQSDAVSMLKHADSAMNSALNIVQTIREKVVYAGNGSLSTTAAAAIADEIDALKDGLLDILNQKVGGKYLFGGKDTSNRPFVKDESGRIRYVGSDERIRYEIENGILGDVSFTGSEIAPEEFKSYFVCSHFVPLDWRWTGREEKVQITVGNRTLPVFIPERWIDEVATGTNKPTDYNQFRDPDELTGISLDDVATLVNRALKEQGVDMLVTASVEKDFNSGVQRLVFKSNTGEPISITGWPATDYQPMAQSLAGLKIDPAAVPDWNHNMLIGDQAVDFTNLSGNSLSIFLNGTSGATVTLPPGLSTPQDVVNFLNTSGALPANVTASQQEGKIVLTSSVGGDIRVDGTAASAVFGGTRSSADPQYRGLMGSVNTLGWRDDTLGKGITITVGSQNYDFSFAGYRNISDLAKDINARIPTNAGDLPFASVVSGRLVFQSTLGDIQVSDYGTAGGTQQLFGYDGSGANSLNSSSSSLLLKLGDQQPVRIYVNEGDTLAQIADRINAIEGLYARTSADGKQLVVVAQRTGEMPSDPLSTDTAQEKLHYPSFLIWGEGMGMSLFDFTFSTDSSTGIQTGVIGSQEETRPIDHSHIDLFSYLGMETTLKSVEFEEGEVLTVTSPLHWRIMSGSHVTEIRLNPGTYTMEQLAERLKNAGAGWLETTVDVFRLPNIPGADDTEVGLGTSANRENATSRLVIRSLNGDPVVFMDMNDQRYAEELGLSTAVRTDENMGVSNIVFPTAPCLDAFAGMMRVQMTCGKAYDIRLSPKEILGADGNVDRVKVMEQIARQVNAQAGEEVLRVVFPVDASGARLGNSASLVAVTGEPFSVVDLPVSDPVWADYTAGLAAQMGVHTGVTSNLQLVGIKDSDRLGQAGTIRFEALGRTVEIDVSANDTVKDIMDRLRVQAGDWLYVNYFDPAMGNSGTQAGDFPIISIAAKDGSAVNVLDISGSVAQDLKLNTSIQGDVSLYDSTTGNVLGWTVTQGATPPQTFSISVAGYTHTIDLTAMRDINGNGLMDAVDLVATINSRMQDYDVRAELSASGELVLWSPRGYTIEVEAWQLDAAGDPSVDITSQFLGTGAKLTPYRGGYDLENPNRTAPGIYTQNITARSGANQTKQNFFGVLEDISAAIRAENRDGLSDKLLPKVDAFMDGLLRVMSAGGALQNRYEANIARLKTTDLNLTEVHDSLTKVNLAEVSTQLLMAKSIYEASLSVISQVVKPTLLDFLR